MSRADEEADMATSGAQPYTSKEDFAKLKAKFDFKKILTELIIKKENFVLKKDSDIYNDYTFEKELG